MTEREAHEIVTYLAAAYPSARIGDETLQVYIGELVDLRAAPCRAACRTLVRQGGLFFPTISEIRRQTAREADKARLLLRLEDQRGVPCGNPQLGARLRALIADLARRRALEPDDAA